MAAVTSLIVAAVVVVVVLVLLLLGYNALVERRNRVQQSWAQVDVQLVRRHELIPNLVSTVQGYAAHERTVLQDVTEARTRAVGATGPADRAGAEDQLTKTLRTLFAVAEAYPDLKASSNFLSLQADLTDTEDKISYARQFYNNAVNGLNDAVQKVPTNIVAVLFRFRTAEYFTAGAGQRGPITVRF